MVAVVVVVVPSPDHSQNKTVLLWHLCSQKY